MMVLAFVASPLFKKRVSWVLLTFFPHMPVESVLLPPTAAHSDLKVDEQDVVFMLSFCLPQSFKSTYFMNPSFTQASKFWAELEALQDLSTEVAT